MRCRTRCWPSPRPWAGCPTTRSRCSALASSAGGTTSATGSPRPTSRPSPTSSPAPRRAGGSCVRRATGRTCKRLDLRRMLEPDWFQHPRMLGYAAYADRFARRPARRRRARRRPRRARRHVPPPDAAAAAAARARTTADTPSPTTAPCAPTWARRRPPRRWPRAAPPRHQPVPRPRAQPRRPRARRGPWPRASGDRAYRRYFHIFPDRTMPDAYERTLPEVFPDFAPGNFTWDDDVDGWVWTTFNEWQWDVDWSNPDVVCEYADVILFLANLGVEVLRLDAIAFIWKRLGTTCQNQPEVHAITQALRAARPPRLPGRRCSRPRRSWRRADVVHYLGRGAPSRQGQRPRLPQQPDGADLVDAGQPRRAPVGARAASDRRGARRRRRGSRTPAATTTSAGPSTTPTRRPWTCPARPIGRSCRTTTRATSGSPRPEASSSSTTR